MIRGCWQIFCRYLQPLHRDYFLKRLFDGIKDQSIYIFAAGAHRSFQGHVADAFGNGDHHHHGVYHGEDLSSDNAALFVRGHAKSYLNVAEDLALDVKYSENIQIQGEPQLNDQFIALIATAN